MSRSEPWAADGCHGTLTVTRGREWRSSATCDVHDEWTYEATGTLAYATVWNEARRHASIVAGFSAQRCTCEVVGFTSMGGGYPDQPDYEQDPDCPVHGVLAVAHTAYPGMLNTAAERGRHRGRDTPMADQAETTTTTEYGIRYADGTIAWLEPDTAGAVHVATGVAQGQNVFQVVSSEGHVLQERAARALEGINGRIQAKAADAHIPYTEDLVPRLVKRQVLVVRQPVEAVDLTAAYKTPTPAAEAETAGEMPF